MKTKKTIDLRPDKSFLPSHPAKESAELARLANFLNTSAGITAPKQLPVAEPIKATPITEQPTQQSPAASQGSATAPAVNLSRIFFTGRFHSGKDFVAAAAGFSIFSIAQPIYALQKLFFGSDDKSLPGARTFLQVAGQIGRGHIDAQYPLSIERASFIALVRDYSHRLPNDYLVDWSTFGTNSDLWLDALLRRVACSTDRRIAMTNCRFLNEFQRLTKEGFQHIHVLCSAATWTARLKVAELTPESPAAKDLSEQLAAGLDASVMRQISVQRTGPKLSCVWSDDRVPPPSGRLLTVSEFVSMFPKI